ncbi:MAG: HIT family protein [Gammaproteobacteria bacterium]
MAYDQNNIFAKILRGEATAHKVYEDDATLAIMDVMPQADGHTLVLPKQSAENLFDLDKDTMTALLSTTQAVGAAVRIAFGADGIRLMQFNGAAAGQSVFHFHIHIIPCHDGRGLGRHADGMADEQVLAEHAERIRVALDNSHS